MSASRPVLQLDRHRSGLHGHRSASVASHAVTLARAAAPFVLPTLTGAALSWTAQRRADRHAVAFDPAWRTLQQPLEGRAQATQARDGTRLHVEIFGPDDAPTVVLVHGWTCALRFWTCQIQALADELRIVTYDLRGHGRSGPAEGGDYSIEGHASDLDAVLRSVAREGERPVVAGHSLGAMTIVAWARASAGRVGDQVSAAGLLNTGVGDLIDEARVLPAPTPLAAVQRATSRLILGVPAPLPRNPSPVSHRIVRHVALERGASPGQVAFCENMVLECRRDARAGCGGAISGLDLNDSVESLDVPTVVLAGDADRLTPPSHARRLADRLPHLDRTELIPGAGHMCPVTHPDRVTDTLRRLVADHGPGVHEGEETVGPGHHKVGAEPIHHV